MPSFALRLLELCVRCDTRALWPCFRPRNSVFHGKLPASAAALAAAGCSGPRLPSPDSADARYDKSSHAVQALVSNRAPPSDMVLVSPDGGRYPATGISIVSGPHVLYSAPPSVGLGIGGFGFGNGGFGSGVGVGVPLGRPTPAEVSDQVVASAQVVVAVDYATRWKDYHLEIVIGDQPVSLAAPPL